MVDGIGGFCWGQVTTVLYLVGDEAHQVDLALVLPHDGDPLPSSQPVSAMSTFTYLWIRWHFKHEPVVGMLSLYTKVNIDADDLV